MKLNKVLTKEEQIELSADIALDYSFGDSRYDYRRKPGYLPEYIREAMKREGVIRLADGRFVKESEFNKSLNVV